MVYVKLTELISSCCRNWCRFSEIYFWFRSNRAPIAISWYWIELRCRSVPMKSSSHCRQFLSIPNLESDLIHPWMKQLSDLTANYEWITKEFSATIEKSTRKKWKTLILFSISYSDVMKQSNPIQIASISTYLIFVWKMFKTFSIREICHVSSNQSVTATDDTLEHFLFLETMLFNSTRDVHAATWKHQ